jgi:hypothetical protein
MSITVAVFVQKKPELSTEDFQAAYDQYLPKLKSTLGEEAQVQVRPLQAPVLHKGRRGL